MPSARLRLLRLAAAAAALLAGGLAGCEAATSTDVPQGDAGADATGEAGGDAPAGSDGAADAVRPGTDGAAEGAADAEMDARERGDAADGGAPDGAGVDAASDTRGDDVVVDSAGFFDSAGDDGGVCNTLANPAPLVQQVNVATARPAGTGGSLVDGTYFKSADVIYTGPGGNSGLTGYTVRETLVVTNSSTGTALLTSTFVDTVTTTERLTMSPTVSAGPTTLVFVCPAYGPSATFFNMRVGDAGETLLDIAISTDRIETFTRQ